MPEPAAASGSTRIFVDADACPVREEVQRVATRYALPVFVVSNGSRPIRPSADARVQLVIVNQTPDAADDWIAERIGAGDVCVTGDIPLAARCLANGARAVAHNGKHWTEDNIGNALAGRAMSQHMRELGMTTGGGGTFGKADRSRFLVALDTAVTAAMRTRVR
jgi:uncharacterized protein YaiI (UPF0178 family)